MRAALVIVLALGACTPRTPPATPAGPPAPDPDFLAGNDPINTVQLDALHRKSQRILGELIAALPKWHRDKVANATLEFGEAGINAFAYCAGYGQPGVAITDDLLHVLARVAAARANEEIFDVDATRAYLAWMAAHMSESGRLPDPPQDREDPLRRIDRRKLARQHELFDEGVAWILGHELAHHYLNHVTCDRDGGIVGDIRHEVQAAIPAFHQPDELAADAAGIANVLAAGKARPGYTWKQRGALLVLEFFARAHRIGLPDIVFAFAITHPPAELRIPALKTAVASWYLTNGVLPPTIPYPTVPLAAQ